MQAVYAAQRQSEDLKSHRESVTIKGSLILPSQFTRLMEKDGLIRRLRDHIKPSTIKYHRTSVPNAVEGQYSPARIRHAKYVDWIDSTEAYSSRNRNCGFQTSLMRMHLGLTIANLTCV